MARRNGPPGALEKRLRSASLRTSRRGFSLIELLIVLAVLTILMAVLTATFANLRGYLWRINCGSNQRQVAIAWTKYSLEKGKLPISNTGGVEAWQRSSEFGNTTTSITSGCVWPYVQELSLYRCQTSAYNYYVSYTINARLRGEDSAANTFKEVLDPAGTMLFIEEYDNRGYNMNSFLISPLSYNWVDVVAGNHDNGDMLTFVDGHVEYWKWLDPRTLTFAGGHYCSAPGSVDLQRLGKVYDPWRIP